MIGRIWNFIKRHKKKVIVTGLAVWGGTYLFRYVRRKFREFQEIESAECLAQARRQHHFDSNQRTCNITVLSMLPKLREVVICLLNTEECTEQLKSIPSNKLQIWEELKILSFTRCVAIVYGCTMMCLLLRIQLNIIGGYMFLDNAAGRNGVSKELAPPEVQEKYLSLIRVFFSEGLAELIPVVKDAVVKETGSISLKEKLSVSNITAIVSQIRERIENGKESTLRELPTLPLGKYMLNVNKTSVQDDIESDIYTRLLYETRDVLESNDFHTVFKLCLDHGFGKLLDFIADHFKEVQKTETSIISLHETSIPVAKLIPFISRLIYKLGSDAPNPLVQEILVLEQTKTFAANIYEAFSHSEDPEDLQLVP
ncbi:hypothetical protein CHS0354_004127 [Potamilus streckersoni]|uniref:Peroxisomal biogenesis factor 3 n=1 Tax=Potamilus streckersoni TaxID=2493646 RepID=A0AAE0SJM7_9BIVA|nr:hypothetical protein CHS0354_004127 [Potamilus streckersoni]